MSLILALPFGSTPPNDFFQIIGAIRTKGNTYGFEDNNAMGAAATHYLSSRWDGAVPQKSTVSANKRPAAPQDRAFIHGTKNLRVAVDVTAVNSP